MSKHTEEGARYRRARLRFLSVYTTCWICGHEGANTIDHVVPRSIRRTRLDIANWRAAHGVDGCSTCPPHGDGRLRKCNQERGTKPITMMGNAYVPKVGW